ncbi:unnamed protein product [Ectocarpus sp. 6 AP-2014]
MRAEHPLAHSRKVSCGTTEELVIFIWAKQRRRRPTEVPDNYQCLSQWRLTRKITQGMPQVHQLQLGRKT